MFRALDEAAADTWNSITATKFFRDALTAGEIVGTKVSSEAGGFVRSAGYSCALEHDRIATISWPWEWSFSMLQDAALLQLRLLASALQEDCALSDATPFNYQFEGVKPLLMDTGSLVVLREGQTWEGYRQFCEQFLNPLLLQAWKGVDFQPWLRGRLEGITAEQFSHLLSARDLLRRGALTHVWLHARLSRHGQAVSVSDSLSSAGFHKDIILRNVAGLQKIVRDLRWAPGRSSWSEYVQQCPHVTDDEPVKSAFVREACVQFSPGMVWDIGCNQGHYSRIAAEFSRVLALDSDHLTIDRLYQRLRDEASASRTPGRITPLVFNVADPAPSLGWRHQERPCLEERSRPDLVFSLALIHHLVIGSNLRLGDVLDWLHSLQSGVVLEWVDRQDPMVVQMLKNRRDIFSDYHEERLLEELTGRFTILRSVQLPSKTRRLYLLQPVSGTVTRKRTVG